MPFAHSWTTLLAGLDGGPEADEGSEAMKSGMVIGILALTLLMLDGALLAKCVSTSSVPSVEFAFGGGSHANPDVPDFVMLPSGPSINVRLTRWFHNHWGVTGGVTRGLTGGGDTKSRVSGADPFTPLTHVQVLVRGRIATTPCGRGQLFVGFGPGAIWVNRVYPHPFLWEREFLPHLLNLELSGGFYLTDRLSLRVGVGLVPPFLVHPVGLLAWRF